MNANNIVQKIQIVFLSWSSACIRKRLNIQISTVDYGEITEANVLTLHDDYSVRGYSLVEGVAVWVIV